MTNNTNGSSNLPIYMKLIQIKIHEILALSNGRKAMVNNCQSLFFPYNNQDNA